MPVAWSTTQMCLEELCELKAGQRVLVHAATGGVGIVAVQYAQHVGAIVYATAGRAEKHEYLRGMGVKHTGSSRDFEAFGLAMRHALDGQPLHVVLNSLSHQDYIPESLLLLDEGGHFVEIGKRNVWSVERVAAMRPGVVYHVVATDTRMEEDPAWMGRVPCDMAARAEDSAVVPLHRKVFELRSEGVEAFRYLQRAQHIGKVVISIGDGRVHLDAESSYIVTGGTGALGLVSARWLMARGARHVVLASRSGKVAQGAEQHWEWLQAASEADVRVHRCDVGSREDVAAMVVGTRSSEKPIGGVLHAAGVLADAMLEKQTAEGLHRVWGPKVNGAHHLHEATGGCELQLFVLFSSVASMLGSAGQAN